MGVRNFTDAGGTAWTVFDVRPSIGDRRSGYDRRARMAPDLALERRRRPERRVRDRPRSVLPAELAQGWLCFESDGETRRLAPIPDGWEQAPESALEAFRQRATARPARGTRTRSH